MEDQDEFLIRKSEYEEVGLETFIIRLCSVLEDVGQNADLNLYLYLYLYLRILIPFVY